MSGQRVSTAKRKKTAPIAKNAGLRNNDNEIAKKMATSKKTKKVAAVKPLIRIGVLVHDVSRMRRTMFDQAVEHLGITRAQWWILSNLSRHKFDGMNQSELARFLFVGKPTIGGLIDRLTESGMIERRLDGEDRRVKKIYITDKGYELIYQMSPIATKLNAFFLQGINENDIKVAEHVLEKMKKNLQVLFEDGPALKLPETFRSQLLNGNRSEK